MNCGRKKMNQGGKVPPDAENDRLAMESMNEKRKSDEATLNRGNRGPTTRRRAHRMPKYAEGGEVNTDEMSFGKAFRHFRNAGDKTFTWKGKKYTTELAKPEAPKAKPETPTATRVESAQESMRTGKPMTDSGFTSVRKPSSGPTTRGGARRPAPVSTRRSEGVSRREFGQNLKGPKYSASDIKTAENVATALGAAASAAPGVGVAMRGARGLAAADAAAAAAARKTAEAAARRAARKKAAEDAAAAARKKTVEATASRTRRANKGTEYERVTGGRTSNMRRGGPIKKYAAGGAVTRGDGISRVKTRCRMR